MKHITRRKTVQRAVGSPCHYCNRKMIQAPRDIRDYDQHQRGLICTEEHIRCRVHGGGNEESNIVFACARCNATRGHVDYDVFFMFAKQVIVHYPDVPNMFLRAALVKFISSLAEIAIQNKKASKKAIGKATSLLVEELRKVKFHP